MIKKNYKSSSKALVDEIKADFRATPHMGIKRCMQCGLCTSNCPAARHSDYDPREMVKKVLDNNLEVLDSRDIWNCFYCYTCGSNCPVNNSPALVNQILRQKGLLKGVNVSRVAAFLEFGYNYMDRGVGTIPHHFYQDLVADFGIEYQEMKENIKEIRQSLGLEDYNLKGKAIKEVRSILNSSGFSQRLRKLKKMDES